MEKRTRRHADGPAFQPKPKSATVIDRSKLPVDLQWRERASPNVTVDKAPKDEVPEPVATEKRLYVTKALVKEQGKTMGRPRCSSGIGLHNAECHGRIEGILLQQSRMKPKQEEEEEPRGGRTTTTPAPMELEKPTGPATQHGGSIGSGVLRNDVASTGAMQTADEKSLEAPDVDMGAQDSCEAQVKRAKTIMGQEICGLEAQDNVYDEAQERRRTWPRRLVITQQMKTLWHQK